MNDVASPLPTVEATFHVEPHPDPVVQALIEEVEHLRKALKEALDGADTRRSNDDHGGGA